MGFSHHIVVTENQHNTLIPIEFTPYKNWSPQIKLPGTKKNISKKNSKPVGLHISELMY